MSDLLNSASLVMIPSGYKEDVVYSQIPTDGSGDLSFTRASNGTRVNSAGLVEVVPWNLLQQSENFDVSPWTKSSGVTISANSVTAPNGTTTADVITFNGSNRDVQQVIAVTNGVFSFYAKGSGTIFVGIASGTQTQTEFTLTSDWSRIEVPFTGTSSSVFIGNYGTTATSVTLWGAQLNIGSTAKPYFPTTDRLNVPRLTYQNGGGGCPSLLLEKQSTNYAKYSNDTSNAVYNYQNSSVSSGVTSPDGTANAYGIVADTASNTFHRWYQSIGGLSGIWTSSIYVKNGTSKYFAIGMNANGSTGNQNVVVFDLTTGTIASNPYSVNATITSVGNGWYQCTHTFDYGTGGGAADLCVHNAGLLSNYTAFDFQVYDSPSVSTTLYVWGVQVEQSSYATSLIPTTSSSATRVADACYKTGISSLIGQTEGTLFADVDLELNGDAAGILAIMGSGVTFVYLFTSQITNVLNANVYNNGTPEATMSYSLPSAGRYKMAIAYKQNDFVLYVNGIQRGADTSGNVPTCSDLYIDSTTYTIYPNSKHNQIALFKTRLTNAELASLTTI